MEIHGHARIHGVADDDIVHAVRYHLRAVNPWRGDDRTLFIGPDTAGRLLQVVVVGVDSDDPTVIHARALTAALRRHLREERP